jgi:hypothetical protein
MLNVLWPRRNWGPSRAWQWVVSSWAVVFLVPAIAWGQAKSTTQDKGAPASSKADAKKADAKKADDDDKAAPAPDVVAPNTADPSKTKKISPNETFRDERAEALLDVNKYKHESRPGVGQAETDAVRAMAGDPNVPIDKNMINRVVDAMISKLTDHQNIAAVVNPPANLKMNSPQNRAINEATTTLLEPIFLARSAKNEAFQSAYNRILLDKLDPVLRNHLVPRVQAMIVLGQSANPDALRLFKAQIADKNQTLWVKLWALEGMTNIVEEGGRLTGQAQVDAAKVVADFLNNGEDVPWPVQLRALEALSAMRQGFDPSRPTRAEMANAAMRVLADPESKLDVRAEAARALGLMPVTPAVPKYNFSLIAHAAADLASELATNINAQRTENVAKANYLGALLIGSVYQCFDGVPGVRDSGLVHLASTDSAPYVQKVFDLTKAVVKSSVDLLASGQRQIKDRQKELTARVAALKDFLAKNPPPDRHLVRGGAEYPTALAPQAVQDSPPGKVVGAARGRK